MGLSSSEDRMIVAGVVLTQCHRVTDGQTDGQTDGFTIAPKDAFFSATECALAVQGHSRSSKVDAFGTNRKRVYDFLLVINSNFGPILHRFRVTATYWLKIAYFPTPLSFVALVPYVPFGISRQS